MTVATTVLVTVPPTVPVTVTPTTAPADACESATQDVTIALDVVLDRVNADSLTVAESELLTIFTDLGESLGRECGESRIGEAMSAVIVWLTNEAPTRTEPARAAIDGVLRELCPGAEPYGLSALAQVACADIGSGNDAGYSVDDFLNNAEEFIESDVVAAQAGTTFTDAACTNLEKVEIGEPFTCTATGGDGTTWDFDLEITSFDAYEITSGAPRN